VVSLKELNLSGKVAVVTGGAGELGRVMVRELANCGADVAICYYSKEEAAQALKTEIEQKYNVKAVAVYADVTCPDSVAAMKVKVNETLGLVDIIVNNAVIQHKWKPLLEEDIDSYENQFKSCVMQGVYMAKAFVPDMISKNYGRVIGINTECAMQMLETQSAYAAGKRGMDAVYKVLAREVGRYNITVNEVAPGWTESDRFRNADKSEIDIENITQYTNQLPMRRRGTDLEVANAVCFLASDLASFITGVYLPVCGGNVMPCI